MMFVLRACILSTWWQYARCGVKEPAREGHELVGVLGHEIRGEGADTGKQEGGVASLDTTRSIVVIQVIFFKTN